METHATNSDGQVASASATGTPTAKAARPARKTKTKTLHKLLAHRNGATLAQLQAHLDWQPHTVRAAISRLRRSGVLVDLDRSGKVARYRARPGEG